MLKVYLGGPIRGLDFNTSQDWRNEVAGLLAPEITAFSPLRGKEELFSHEAVIDEQLQPVDHPLTVGKGVVARDYNDVATSDLVFVNFLRAERISIGSLSEIAWSYVLRKPVVLAMEEGNVHEHLFVREQVSFIVPTLDEAIEIIKAVLLP